VLDQARAVDVRRVANRTGLPALSLPSGRSADDEMPVGTMLTGAQCADHLLLRVGATLEGAGADG
jgi:Asp-tRNA(Asn)/Glu-tRNA(Gln) amidotransferase A subunit family amidase